MRTDVWARRHREAAFALAVALQAAITLPFTRIDASDVRGVPGPTLVLITTVAAFLLGSRLGALLGVIASGLAVAVFDVNWYIAGPLWVGFAVLSGYVGSRSNSDSEERSQLSYELQSGLLPPAAAMEEHPRLRAAARYLAGEDRLLPGGDFYGVLELDDASAHALVGD